MSKPRKRLINALLAVFYYQMLLVSWPVFLRCVLSLLKVFEIFTVGFTLTTGVAVYFITREAYRRMIKPIMEEEVAHD